MGPIRVVTASLAKLLQLKASYWCEGQHKTCLTAPVLAIVLPKPIRSKAKTSLPLKKAPRAIFYSSYMKMLFIYLHKVSNACWGSEDDPLVHRHGLLVLILLDGDVPPEEQQRERGHLGAVVQENLRICRDVNDGAMKMTTNTLTNSMTG